MRAHTAAERDVLADLVDFRGMSGRSGIKESTLRAWASPGGCIHRAVSKQFASKKLFLWSRVHPILEISPLWNPPDG